MLPPRHCGGVYEPPILADVICEQPLTAWYSIKVEDLIKDENMMHYVKQICYHQFLGVGKFITGVRIFWCFKKFLFDSFFAFARTIFSNFT